MPVPIPGPEVKSDSLKVKFLTIFGRPKTGFFGEISGAPGYIPPIPASYQPRSSGSAGDEASKSVVRLGGSALRMWSPFLWRRWDDSAQNRPIGAKGKDHAVRCRHPRAPKAPGAPNVNR